MDPKDEQLSEPEGPVAPDGSSGPEPRGWRLTQESEQPSDGEDRSQRDRALRLLEINDIFRN